MAQFDDLLPYLPSGDYEPLFSKWLEGLNYQIAISRPRKSKLGDFRPPRLGQIARITMNADLGPFQFLTTLTHEIAHLIAWEKNTVVLRHRTVRSGKLFFVKCS